VEVDETEEASEFAALAAQRGAFHEGHPVVRDNLRRLQKSVDDVIARSSRERLHVRREEHQRLGAES